MVAFSSEPLASPSRRSRLSFAFGRSQDRVGFVREPIATLSCRLDGHTSRQLSYSVEQAV
jgi:hypothetical protein